jgi:prepilin-type N-terminal cleavage/methylation domain-containing protein
MHRNRRRRDGFTLLEATVALTIIGVCVIGAFGAFGAQLRADQRARAALPIEALAEERMAALLLMEPQRWRVLPDTVRRGRFPAPFADHTWEASTHEVPRERDLRELVVTVRGPTSALTLRTRRYRPVIGAGEVRP